MAKLTANGRFEITRLVLSRDHEDGSITRVSYAFMSDGWVLRKIGTGGWKTFCRVPGFSGRGLKAEHAHLPSSTDERGRYDNGLRLIFAAAKRMADGYRSKLPQYELRQRDSVDA